MSVKLTDRKLAVKVKRVAESYLLVAGVNQRLLQKSTPSKQPQSSFESDLSCALARFRSA
jgi:hypothetical protein